MSSAHGSRLRPANRQGRAVRQHAYRRSGRWGPEHVGSLARTVGWDVIFYETQSGDVPAADFLDGCPARVRGTILAVLDAVAAAPPPSFSGGGKWEAMHGSMGGYYEIRLTGPGREQFRLFCILENADAAEMSRR